MLLNFISQYRSVILYGVLLAVLLLLLRWLEWHFIIIDNSVELYAGGVAVVFTALGMWLYSKLSKPKTETLIIEKKVIIDPQNFEADNEALASTGLSKRELEVLQLMAKGLSNQDIADQMFVSLNTIKTHSSKVFEKLDVQRRTQAVDKAKKLRLIA
ncbi:DNA-binding response regulator [Mucilaginibacter conchicola]|uniref:DNA-binding response regulator n=1 Tax=Mucilaginibacter conchicola TaxID=2303333 RepID=A0A372P0T1_9SPHI|nr:response regulator transcription factor [Mucilaginibacter conchicola]RFZ95791.1 DNA-binding response regulator [Mucilaginibacter conchicola]